MAHFFLDFDYTLGFVTNAIDGRIDSLMATVTRTSADIVSKAYDRRTEVGYSIKNHLESIKALCGNINFDIEVATTIIIQALSYEFREILYEDVLNDLEMLKRAGHTYSFVTFGGRDYQFEKLEATGLLDSLGVPNVESYFRIVEGKGGKPLAIKEIISALELHGETLVFVDDKLGELILVREFSKNSGLNILCVQMVRDHKRNAADLESGMKVEGEDDEWDGPRVSSVAELTALV